MHPISLKPVTTKSFPRTLHESGALSADRLFARIAEITNSLDVPGWIRGNTRLPVWQVALVLVLIVAASLAIPANSLQHQKSAATTGVSTPLIADSLPVDPPVKVPAAAVVQTQPVAGNSSEQQIAGLQESSQTLLTQIQKAQHDYSALRNQIEAQDQTLGTVQSQAAANNAEQSAQQQVVQSQMQTAVQAASGQLAQLNTSVSALDTQANELRRILGMGASNYPAVKVPDLSKAADPAQAFNDALNAYEAHVTAVSTDLQSIKSTAQKQLAYAQSVSSVQSVVTSGHGSGVFIWPTSGTISQPFGPTSLALEPAYGGYAHFHLGVDIANIQGTPIVAAAAGTVIYAGWTTAGYGNMVEIDHGNGLMTLYGHMMTTPSVTVGQSVFQGELIGYMGTTGNSTGPHCHFGVQQNGVWVNPMKFLP